MQRRTWLGIGLLAGLLAVAPAESATACPNCKGAISTQGEEASGRLADGFNASILFMMAMPFVLLGTGTAMVVRAVKKGGIPEL